MGCCRSTSKVHHDSDLDEVKVSALAHVLPDTISTEIENPVPPKSAVVKVNKPATSPPGDPDLDQFLRRQSTFEEELKSLYSSREREYEFPTSDTTSIRSRVIKPFLSSTFRDFSAERDYLLQKCFPLISRECRSRGLEFMPIDLRWGVTTNQCNSGQVIKICLDEITNCRPYFLCFLGFRNGWSLIDNQSDKLLNKTFDVAAKSYSWIYQYRQRSVTELEILHAIGTGTETADPIKSELNSMRCIFYLKSVHYLRDQIQEHGHSAFVDFDRAETALMDLKRRIVALEHCKIRWFNSCDHLSNEIQRDLQQIVDLDFSDTAPGGEGEGHKKGMNLDDGMREELRQQQLFRNLLTNKVYVDVNGIGVTLKQFLHRNRKKSLLLLVGDSGIGKSTVLANLSLNITASTSTETKKCFTKKRVKSNLVITRFIGISIASQSIISLLKSIIAELEGKYRDSMPSQFDGSALDGDDLSVQDVMDHLVDLIDHILSVVLDDDHCIVFVLDGIDRFESEGNGSSNERRGSLYGLQFINLFARSTLNGNPRIRVIASICSRSITRRQIKKLEALGESEVITMSAMNGQEIRLFIEHYLKQYGKVMDEGQKSMLLEAEQRVKNPLFLSILLEEMRCFGSFENLNGHLASYLAECDNISKLFQKVLHRLSLEGEHGVDLLRHILCLLTVSRNGLLINELEGALEFLMNVSKKESTFPMIECMSLLHQLTALHVVNDIDDKLIIIQPAITEAVKAMYFESSGDGGGDNGGDNDNEGDHEQIVMTQHLKAIAMSLTQIYGDDIHQRFIEEVPHALYRLIDLETDHEEKQKHRNQLRRVLLNLKCIPLMKQSQNVYHFNKFWTRIDNEEEGDIDGDDKESKSMAERFKTELNHFELTAEIANHWRDLGIFMVDTSRYHDAQYFLIRCLQHHEKNTNDDDDDDDQNLDEIESIHFELGKLHQKEGRFEESLVEYEKCIDLLQRQQEHLEPDDDDKDLSLTLLVRRSASAGILQQLGRWKEAASHYECCLERKRILLNDDKHPLLAIDMVNIATICIENANGSHQQLERARTLIAEAEVIFESHFGADCLQIAAIHSLRATLHQKENQYLLALKSLEKSKEIKRCKLGETNIALVDCLCSIGTVHLRLAENEKNDDQQHHIENALVSFQKALDLCAPTQRVRELILCHRGLSNGYRYNKQYALSLQHLMECQQIIEDLEGSESVLLTEPLLDSANIYAAEMGDYQSAEPLYHRVISILKSNQEERGKRALKWEDIRMEMECLEGLSQCHLLQNVDYEKTNETLDQQLILIDSLSISDDVVVRKRMSILLGKIAVLMAQSNYIGAWSMLKEMVLDLEEKTDSEGLTVDSLMMTTYNLCGTVMLQLGRYNDAIKFYEKQFELIHKVPNDDETENGLKSPSNLIVVQLLAFLHFGNDMTESMRLFELYGEHCDDDEKTKENQLWVEEIKQADSLII